MTELVDTQRGDNMHAVVVWTQQDDAMWIEALFRDAGKAARHAAGFNSLTSAAHVRPVRVIIEEQPR